MTIADQTACSSSRYDRLKYTHSKVKYVVAIGADGGRLFGGIMSYCIGSVHHGVVKSVMD